MEVTKNLMKKSWRRLNDGDEKLKKMMVRCMMSLETLRRSFVPNPSKWKLVGYYQVLGGLDGKLRN